MSLASLFDVGPWRGRLSVNCLYASLSLFMLSHVFFYIFPSPPPPPPNIWEWWCSDVSHYFDRCVYRCLRIILAHYTSNCRWCRLCLGPYGGHYSTSLPSFEKKNVKRGLWDHFAVCLCIHLCQSLCSSMPFLLSVYPSILFWVGEAFQITCLFDRQNFSFSLRSVLYQRNLGY
jgi:hypothetical protein